MVFICLLGVSVFIPRSDSFLFINGLNNYYADLFFKYITYLGDGLIYILPFIIFLFIRFRYSLIFLFTFIFEGVLSQFLKKVIFTDVSRPLKYFMSQNTEFHIPEGVKLHKSFSFPSGHSSTAFAVATLLALLIIPAKYRWLAVVMAFLVALSRVYIGQHFIPDIAAGSLIGTSVATLVFWYFTENKAIRNNWLDKKWSCC